MNPQAIYTLWLRELKRFFRAKSRIIGGITQSFFFLAIVGVGLNNVVNIPGFSYTTFMAPGIVAMSIMFPSVFAGVSVLWDKQFGFLKEILVAPVSRMSIMLGKALGGATTSLIQGTIMLVAVVLMGVMPFSIYGVLMGFVIMIITAVSFVSLGLAMASKMDDPQGFQLIMNFLVLPMFMLSGAFFPIENLPAPLMALVSINPLTYTVDAMRNVFLGSSTYPLIISMGILTFFCVLMLSLGAYFFKRIK
jgi:ABC-2 type transport system permease protein